MATFDDDWERGGVTRADVLTARGYSTDGNGHVLAASASTNGAVVSVPVELGAPPLAGRTCETCGTPLKPEQARFCSRGCVGPAASKSAAAARTERAKRAVPDQTGVVARPQAADVLGVDRVASFSQPDAPEPQTISDDAASSSQSARREHVQHHSVDEEWFTPAEVVDPTTRLLAGLDGTDVAILAVRLTGIRFSRAGTQWELRRLEEDTTR